MKSEVLLVATFVSLLVSLALTAILVDALPKWGFIDEPNERSSHEVPTPRGGGIAIAAATSLSLAVYVVMAHAHWSSLIPLAPCLVLAAVGLVDDHRSLPATVRLAAQGIASLILVAIVAKGEMPFLLILLGAVFVVVIVNATNFMDGVNGISSLNGIVICIYYAVLASTVDSRTLMVGSVLLAGALLGFTYMNARGLIFMGDVGTYFIGTAFAGLSLWTLHLSQNPFLALAPLMIYLADTLTALTKKIIRREPIFASHKNHVYQRLNARGLSHLEVTLIVALFTTFCACMVFLFAVLGLAVVGYALSLLGVLTYLQLPRILAARDTKGQKARPSHTAGDRSS